MTIVIFVRHGQSEANVAGVFANRGDGYPLTSLGRQQAAALAQSLSEFRVDRVISSPLLRARQTARILAETLGARLDVDQGLAECDMGELEGRSDAAGWQLHAEINRAWAAGDWDRRPPGGESLGDVRARFLPFLTALQSQPAHTYLLVGHGSILEAMLPLVLENVGPSFVSEHRLGHTDVVRTETTSTGLTCRRWACTDIPPQA